MPATADSPARAEGSRFARYVAAIEDGILVLVLAAMIVLAATQILMRNLFSSGLLWGDPALRVAVLWIGMLGAMAATRDDRQISVDVLSRFLPKRWKPRVRVITDTFTAVVAAYVSWHAGRLVIEERAGGMLAFGQVPVWVCEVVLPLAFGLIALRYAAYAWTHLRSSFSRGAGE